MPDAAANTEFSPRRPSLLLAILTLLSGVAFVHLWLGGHSLFSLSRAFESSHEVVSQVDISKELNAIEKLQKHNLQLYIIAYRKRNAHWDIMLDASDELDEIRALRRKREDEGFQPLNSNEVQTKFYRMSLNEREQYIQKHKALQDEYDDGNTREKQLKARWSTQYEQLRSAEQYMKEIREIQMATQEMIQSPLDLEDLLKREGISQVH
ncbi:hypothetical protein EDD86DRAFT_206244 [Gorgonomyces haynaldii]|nr:hypothetical protein EDD86DRAFT_206244 [Gorgonomyces haynaldii]